MHRATRLIPPRVNSVLIGQLRRSAMSVLAHIEQGIARSPDRDVSRVMTMGMAELAELEGHLHAAADAGLLPMAEWQARGLEIIAIRGLLMGFTRGPRRAASSVRSASNRHGSPRHFPPVAPPRSFSHQYSGKLNPRPPITDSATNVGQPTLPMGRFAK